MAAKERFGNNHMYLIQAILGQSCKPVQYYCANYVGYSERLYVYVTVPKRNSLLDSSPLGTMAFHTALSSYALDSYQDSV